MYQYKEPVQLDAFESSRARDEGIEVWVDIKGYDYPYQVSNTAKVRVLDRPTCAASQFRKDRKKIIPGFCISQRERKGYLAVSLRLSRKWVSIPVHRIVATAFISNPENKPQVNHKNGIKTDNRIDNLEWCTPSDNAIHAYDMGLSKCGEMCVGAKLTEDNVIEAFRLRSKGFSVIAIADLFGVYKNAINSIFMGKNWRRFVEVNRLFEKYPPSEKVIRRARSRKKKNIKLIA